MDPPVYDIAAELASFSQELPSYTELYDASLPGRSRGLTTTHIYAIPTKKGAPWLTLRVNSGAKTSNHLPHFSERDTVAGSVHLDLAQETAIKAVVVSLKGDLITTDAASFTFLNVSREVWSSSKGDPRSNHAERLENSPPLPWKEKLNVKSGRSAKTYDLPASFMERGANVTILYRLAATVLRGRFLPKSSVNTTVIYIPRIKPQPPSFAIQLAYGAGHPLIEPSGDPEGWHSLDPVVVSGMLFNAQNVNIRCILSMAKPLSYTRGTTIPLHISLQSSNAQVLDVLYAQKAAVVRLQRLTTVVNDNPRVPGSTSYDPTTEMTYDNASWWPSPFDPTSDGASQTRALQGEIRLPRSLPPTAHLHPYQVNYAVALFPFKATGFTMAHPANMPLQRVQVEIATMFAQGPRPVSYSHSFVPT